MKPRRALRLVTTPAGNPSRLDLATLPARRGYHACYRENEVNRCPGCRRSHWYIGRFSAECAFCGTALPFEQSR